MRETGKTLNTLQMVLRGAGLNWRIEQNGDVTWPKIDALAALAPVTQD